MIAKYHIEYAMHIGRNAHVNHYQTDDPVAAEEFLVHVLEQGYRFHALRHEGLELPRNESDKMLKTAAGVLASRRLCTSLGIKPDEEHFRFGFAA
ncbi:MAG: hypothetical protein EBS05_06110 [Proteobacteria bacterium]|jgi:hypothetical protein|nr:hypothetical protein [Pseudomonadota bacterium]